MRVFLLDLWLDLRAKRLAPVAILLIAAIIAVPIVLAKSSKNEVTPAPTTTTAAAPAAPVVQSNPQLAVKASRLGTFSPRDPFQPTRVIATTSGTASAPASSGGGAASQAPTTGTTTAPGGTGQTGGGTTGAPTTGAPGTTTPETKTTLFTYTVDLRFGPPGDEKKYSRVQRLELLPDSQNPKIVFLGVTTSAKTAVFLVDSSLGVDTEGKCKPSPNECTFLYLRPDADHDQAELTDQDGNTFRVHLLAIHRVSVSSSTGGGGSNSNQSGSSNRSPAFTGSADSHDSSGDTTQTGDAPAGEPSQPFQFRGFFGDTEGQ